MKKIIMIFISVLLFSGCSVEYNLNIKNNKYIENIDISNINLENYNILNNSQLALFSDTRKLTDTTSLEEYNSYPKYDKKNTNKNNLYKINYSYDFDMDNYTDSNAVKSCYEYFKITTNGNNVTLSTSNKFNCFNSYNELDKVTINITSYYGVVRSNADKVNGKTYTWEITKENASNKPILFEYDNTKRNITLIDYFTDNIYLVILFGVLLFVVGPILIIIIRKNNKVNKI